MKILHMRVACVFVLLLAAYTSIAQTSFFKADERYLPSFHSGSVMACDDVNGDGLDDLILLDKGVDLKVLYQRPDQKGFSIQSIGVQSKKSKWSIAVGDVFGDGTKDIFLMGAYDHIQWINVDGMNFASSEILAPELYAQGANLADIDRDGVLDLFVCNDIAESHVYRGDPLTQKMIKTNDWIDMQTREPSDNSGNYGSVWTDIDNNGLPDLYLAKCKAGVTDPTDPRRVNTLYLQVDTLAFIESGIQLGLADGSQSWTADFADIDNDGDLDCFVANHKGPSLLFIQDENGRFQEETFQRGIQVNFAVIQAKFADVNNDGYQDLILSGSEQALYINRNGIFEKSAMFLDDTPMTSFVVGDFNSDGWLDIYAAYGDLINLPSSRPDRLWLNAGGVGNYLSFSLKGTLSNADAVGTRIELYADDQTFIREKRAGESYGVQNSGNLHFGLPMGVNLDSVVIVWPSGIKERFTDFEMNRLYHIVENQCYYVAPSIEILGSSVLCESESVVLQAPASVRYQWVHGDTLRTTHIDTPGIYFVNLFDGVCDMTSQSVYIDGSLDTIVSITSTNGSLICSDETTTLTTIEDGLKYQWSTGDTTRSINVIDEGEYQVSVLDGCGQWAMGSYTIEVLESPLIDRVEHDTVLLGGRATLKAHAEKVLWFEDFSLDPPVGQGGWFSIDSLTSDTTLIACAVNEKPGDIVFGGEKTHKGSKLSAPSFNGGLEFTVKERCLLKSVKVFTDTPGKRMIELIGPKAVILSSVMIDAKAGENLVHMGVELMPSSDRYVITTSEVHNLANFGVASPLFYRSDEQVNFPYDMGDLLTLNRSLQGTRFYYYFYDWEVQSLNRCVGECLPVTAKVLSTTHSSDLLDGYDFDMKLYPNPSSGLVSISWNVMPLCQYIHIELFNTAGRNIYHSKAVATDKMIELNPTLPAGVYIVRLSCDELSSNAKLVILE